MNKKSKTPLLEKLLLILASLVLCVGMSTTQALAVSYDSTNNNFTMVAPDATLTGGTNDVHFTWDGTMKTSVAVSGQVSNATISSTCAFNGFTWRAHDVAIYGPGTYTVNPCCPSGRPGCTTTCAAGDIDLTPITPITFTVGAGEMGAHMLFNWSISANIDVVDVWAPNQVFGPSPLFDGTTPGGCSSNSASKVWDLMSKDWGSCGHIVINDATQNEECTAVADGVPDSPTSLNGAPMVDGPFNEQSANFNMMLVPVGCDPNTKPANPNSPCTTVDCDSGTNTWVINNTTASCDADNNICTDDTCSNGFCVVGSTLNCDDGFQCHVHSCDPSLGCIQVSHCDLPTEPTLISPADGATGLGTTLELRWTKSTDPQGDPMTYHITYCKTPNAEGCASVVDVKDTTVAKRDSKGVFYAGGAGLLMIGMTFIGGLTGRKKIITLLIFVVLFAGGAFMSCKNTKNVDTGTPLGNNEVNYMAQGLDPGTTYYWKVEADNGYGEVASSPSPTSIPPAQSFTTR